MARAHGSRWAPASSVALLCLVTGCSRETASVTAEVIFGEDDRVEVYEVVDPALREAVRRAVPAMIDASRVNVDVDTGGVTFSTNRLGLSRDLCAGEAHFDQPTAPSCSATLIDDDLVLTAGHCVEGWDCANQRFVFGWYYDEPDMIHPRRAEDVFACAEVVVSEYTAANDYAIVRLDRAAPGPPLEVRATPVEVSEPVSLAGYPFGLPMKVVEGGLITGTVSRSRFYARLDAHPGNSGSGVLDAELRVLGDLTNGPVEALVRDGDCNRLAVIGEDTWRTELISSVIPAVEALCASGHSSERLCGACGDGRCEAFEVCARDCAPDAGLPDAALLPDASVAADAATPTASDASLSEDASTSDAGAVEIATHCGCRLGGSSHPSGLAALSLWAAAWTFRRLGRARVRARPPNRPHEPPPDARAERDPV